MAHENAASLGVLIHKTFMRKYLQIKWDENISQNVCHCVPLCAICREWDFKFKRKTCSSQDAETDDISRQAKRPSLRTQNSPVPLIMIFAPFATLREISSCPLRFSASSAVNVLPLQLAAQKIQGELRFRDAQAQTDEAVAEAARHEACDQRGKAHLHEGEEMGQTVRREPGQSAAAQGGDGDRPHRAPPDFP